VALVTKVDTREETHRLDFSQKVNNKAKRAIASKGNQIPPWPRWSSGSLSLDVELGGGVPENKIIGVVGEYSAGKTAMVLKMVAGFQKKYPGKPIAWLDAEGAWDPTWAKAIGVDTAAIDVIRPMYGEQAYDIALAAYDEGAGLVVLDSAAALSTKKELENDMETVEVAGMAKIHAKFMRKVSRSFDEADDPSTFIYINQFIQNVSGYGPPLIEKGGEALTKFFPSVKIILKTGEYFDGTKIYKSIGVNDEGVEVKAQAIKFYVEKNKTAPPKRRGHFWFYFDTLDSLRKKGSIDRLEECIRLARKYEVVKQRGKMFDLVNEDTGEVRTFEGSNKLADFIRTDERAKEYVESKVLERVIGDMSGEEEAREETVSEERVAELRVIRNDDEEGAESSEAV